MIIKKLIKKLIEEFISLIIKILKTNRFGWFILDTFFKQINNIQIEVKNKSNLKLYFYSPNNITKYRSDTFFSKEPETLKWIDSFDEESIFFDVGANVGLYSCYAAKSKKIRTFAFEPSVFNLEVLAKNIHKNKLDDLITIVPIAIDDKRKISNFNMSSTETGGALSTFDKKFTHDGTSINKKISYKTLGISLDELITFYNLPKPNFLKIDVDGLEHFILKGANNSLDTIKSILVEIDENFIDQKKAIVSLLKDKNFILTDNSLVSLKEKDIYNQIWFKKDAK